MAVGQFVQIYLYEVTVTHPVMDLTIRRRSFYQLSLKKTYF